ncbi:MAG TPA: SPOR domain-containing protein, partial [Pyrinomonadaceae bacterium]|nr:SPOR domain-containing protein [Pyrinomonadaceae bacterium]
MNYEFSLNKTSVLSLIAGSIVFAFLLFFGGLVVGSYWLTSEVAAIESTKRNEKDALPKEPVLAEEEAPDPKSAAPQKVDPAAAIQSKQPAATTAPEAAAQAAAFAQPNDGEIRILQETAADAPNTAAEADPEYVTVQVGVFLDENEANNLLKRMESRGYSPSYFSGRDAEARQWFAVRIGAYSDKHQAENAAAN